jgi:hypothetical protein
MGPLVGKSYGVRFPSDVQNKILAEADKNGFTQSEVIRNSVTRDLMQPSLEYLFKQMERRMLRHNFEMNCIIVGLNKMQREQAKRDCNSLFKQEVL